MKGRVLVTGHTSGLGLALKNIYEKNGYEVIGISRSCKDDDKNLKIDLSNLPLLEAKLSSFLKGREFDLCFLNAGTLGGIKKAVDLDCQEVINCLSINVLSNKVILDEIIKRQPKGRVIAISSGAANKSYDGWLNYCLSKAGLKQLISCYALENEEFHFLSLAPGVIRTKMQDEIICKNEEEFSSISKFKKLYDKNPTPQQVSKKIFENIDTLFGQESGSFFDLRSLN